jgi:hypothetical protein
MNPRQNLKLATNDELIHLLWDAEENQDGILYKRVKEEIQRRIKYDY